MKIGYYNNSFVDTNEIQKNTNSKSDNKKEITRNTVEKSKNSDKLEISDDVKRFNSIKEKIASGFYDSPEVLSKVAEKIINQFDMEM